MTVSKWEVPPYRKENVMRFFYVVLDLRQKDVAYLFDCSETTIRKWKKNTVGYTDCEMRLKQKEIKIGTK